MTREDIALLSDDEVESSIEKTLIDISTNEDYIGKVFEVDNVYFIISHERILEMPRDAGCSPHGCLLDIITGLTEEQDEYVNLIMTAYDIDECAFNEAIDCTCGDEEALAEYFEDLEDDDDVHLIDVYNKIQEDSIDDNFPFKNAEEAILKFKRYGLEKDGLYYEWEGYIIDLYDNVGDVGEDRGEYDNMDSREWLYVLTNLKEYVVTAYN